MKHTALLAAIALMVVAGCANQPSEPPAQTSDDLLSGQWIDLSYAYSDETLFWPTAEPFELETVAEGMTEGGYYYSAYQFSTAEHGGTHLDAPIHFAANRQTVDQVPVDRGIGMAVKIDVSERALQDRDYLVGIEDFTTWEAEHGPLPDGVIVLLQTGYGRYWPDRAQYMGTDQTGPGAVPLLHFPGLDPEAAQWLVDNRNIKAIGLDTPSIDRGQSTLFESHQVLAGQNVLIFENVANLDQLPDTGFGIVALPMKIEGGSGGPLRIIALIR